MPLLPAPPKQKPPGRPRGRPPKGTPKNPAKTPGKVGRPSAYTDHAGRRICELVADGATLRAIGQIPGLPRAQTIREWAAKHPQFSAILTRAELAKAELLAEEIIAIADDGRNDWMTANDPGNEGYRVNGEHIQRSRLRVDARKWVASKLNPRKYSDKLDVDHSGELVVNIVR